MLFVDLWQSPIVGFTHYETCLITYMKNKYNLNLINQINHVELFDKNLLQFIIQNLDIHELLNHSYYINMHSDINVDGNFTAFLYSKKFNNDDNPVINFLTSNIEINQEPIFTVQHKNKKYQISQNGFNGFKNFHNFFNNLSYQPLQKNEEELIIDLLLNDNNRIYLTFLQDNGKENFKQLLINQIPYLHSLNTNTKNIFLENKPLKKALALYSFEENKNIINQQINIDEIIEKYYKKLFHVKNFDLSSHLQESSSFEIITAFKKHSKSDNFFVWVDKLLHYGANTSNNHLIHCTKNPFSNIEKSHASKKCYFSALNEIVSLAKIVKNDYKFTEDEIFQLFVLSIKSQRKTLFISLREEFELPLNNSTYSSALNKWVINKIPIHEIEKELLKIELDKSLPISSQSHKPKSKI